MKTRFPLTLTLIISGLLALPGPDAGAQSAGSVDRSFNAGTNIGAVFSLAVQPDGKVVVADGNPPQIIRPGDVSLGCAPPSGLNLTVQANVTDADHGQTFTVTLTEGATLLGTQTLVSPANNTLVNFNATAFAPGVHALTATVSDGITSAQCALGGETPRQCRERVAAEVTR